MYLKIESYSSFTKYCSNKFYKLKPELEAHLRSCASNADKSNKTRPCKVGQHWNWVPDQQPTPEIKIISEIEHHKCSKDWDAAGYWSFRLVASPTTITRLQEPKRLVSRRRHCCLKFFMPSVYPPKFLCNKRRWHRRSQKNDTKIKKNWSTKVKLKKKKKRKTR